MKVDFWRALGTAFVSLLAGNYLGIIFVNPLFQINGWVGGALEVVLLVFTTALLSYFYFQSTVIAPSLKNGLTYGGFLVALPFVIGVFDGLAGMPPPPDPQLSYGSFLIPLVVIEIIATLAVPAFVGRYMGKYSIKKHHEHTS